MGLWKRDSITTGGYEASEADPEERGMYCLHGLSAPIFVRVRDLRDPDAGNSHASSADRVMEGDFLLTEARFSNWGLSACLKPKHLHKPKKRGGEAIGSRWPLSPANVGDDLTSPLLVNTAFPNPQKTFPKVFEGAHNSAKPSWQIRLWRICRGKRECRFATSLNWRWRQFFFTKSFPKNRLPAKLQLAFTQPSEKGEHGSPFSVSCYA